MGAAPASGLHAANHQIGRQRTARSHVRKRHAGDRLRQVEIVGDVFGLKHIPTQRGNIVWHILDVLLSPCCRYDNFRKRRAVVLCLSGRGTAGKASETGMQMLADTARLKTRLSMVEQSHEALIFIYPRPLSCKLDGPDRARALTRSMLDRSRAIHVYCHKFTYRRPQARSPAQVQYSKVT